ncbi:hypothetical protein KKH23_09870 [Patescibacteria group bacterium]|nr:hypothetical protein [Patescibacteria group bacterium]MBU0847478.1 hypothetical protein [Patescibacteria group bacterium]
MGTYDTTGGTPKSDPERDRDPPCEVCGMPVDKCQCPECPEHRTDIEKPKMRMPSGNLRVYW